MKAPHFQPGLIAATALSGVLIAGGALTARVAAQDAQCLPFSCFEAGIEGDIWQALPPFGQVNDPSCQNSNPDDPFLPVQANRTCNGQPPPLGSFLFPYALAVDGQKIFVTDQFNHRIQAFSFDGSPVPLTTPIGNGTYGSGISQLNGPEGIAVTQNIAGDHLLAVADAYNGRLAFFNTSDGSPAFSQHFPLLDLAGQPTTPTGIAISPGTQIQPLQDLAADPHRIVVTDRIQCYVYILDAGLNVLAQIPPAPPSSDDPFTVGLGACVQPAVDSNFQNVLPPLGYFGSATGVAIDAAGHIFVADYDNSRVQILDANGAPLGSFGTPPDPSTLPIDAPPPPGTLQHPWAVMVDHLGRIGVTDSDNERIAFFTADFSTTPPTVPFQFQLNAAGSLNGNPTGIAEQVGSDTDPAGRIVVTDTINQRVQRFQLPDLAIASVSVDAASAPPSGSFGLAVPAQKAAPVLDVIPSVEGFNANVLSGPDAQASAAGLPRIDIAPGQIVTYGFTYNPTGTPVSFRINAEGNGGVTHAIEATAAPTVACTDCSTAHDILLASNLSPATASNGWYNAPLNVRIDATSSNPAGLEAIGYQFTSGPEVRLHGGVVHLAPVSGTGGSVDLFVSETGTSTLQYWAVNADGSVEQPRHTLNLSLDLNPPVPEFSFPAATGQDATGRKWYNHAVTVSVLMTDDASGPTTPNGTLTFTAEGRNQFQTVTVTDRAGNTSDAVRSDQGASGRPVNIDLHAPQFTSLPASVTVELTGPGVGALVSGSSADTLLRSWTQTPSLVAVDPPLADTAPGSGVFGVGVPPTGATFPMIGAGPTATAQTITASDAAGNLVTQAINVIVRDTTKPSMTCPATFSRQLSGAAGALTVPVPDLTALVTASDLSGSFTLTQSPSAGSAPAFGVGNHVVTVKATDPSGNFATCSIAVSVADVTPPVITAADMTVPSTSSAGAVVVYSASALDDVDGSRQLTCTPPSGSTLPIGTTPVRCSASDTAGNTATRTFNVTVVDSHTQPPQVIQANVVATATSSAGAVVTFAPQVIDAFDPHPVVTCSHPSGSLFPIGTTTVTCTAVDQLDLTGSVTFTVTVGHSAPVCTAAVASDDLLWPPSHKLATIAVNGLTTADNGSIATVVTSIFQDEPTDGLGDGDTAVDGFGVGTSTAQIRVERSGTLDGRFYYIGFTASTSGGSCSGTVTVAVPHDQTHSPAGQGPRFDSTTTTMGSSAKGHEQR